MDDVEDSENSNFIDPLRAADTNLAVSIEGTQYVESSSTVASEATGQAPVKEWTTFKRFIMQKFPVSKMVSVSSVIVLILYTCVYKYIYFLKINDIDLNLSMSN